MPNFVIDTTAPTLIQVTPITTPSNDNTPSFQFTTNEAGTLSTSISQGFSSPDPANVTTSGVQTITFNTLPEGTYSGETITVTDAVNNAGSLTLPDFVIDTTAPTLSEVTPITTPTNDTTPSYQFTSNEVGTLSTSISQGFSSPNPHTVTTSTTQTITFNTLPQGN